MPSGQGNGSKPFSIAIVSDTQNYADYRNQSGNGFPVNAREMLWDMMMHIARNAQSRGGDIAFVSGLGDSWEHPSSLEPDQRHAALGTVANPVMERILPAAPEKVRQIEVPAVLHAYNIIADVLPFSLVPGNHDHDHSWTDPNRPPSVPNFDLPLSQLIETVGGLHVGSLETWIGAFGDQSDFFREKCWYVASFRDGSNSAQTFAAGGYQFLHLGLEMCPDDEVVAWAQAVIDRHPGQPTILSIHEYLNSDAERRSADILDLTRLDPERNSPQRLWEKLIAPNDQILMTLNGHFHGAAERIDLNHHGHKVYQYLVNYQSRRQMLKFTAPDAKVLDGIGDGWMRLITFDLASATPSFRLRAYSTCFKAFASDLPDYGDWYGHEHPELSPEAFTALDEQTVMLDDFRARFGAPSFNADLRSLVQADA